MTPKTYRHLNARIFNENSGTCSRIVDAIPEVRGWSLKTKSEIDGRLMDWNTRDIWRCNRLVGEDFKLKQKPLYGRAKRLFADAQKDSFQPRRGFFCTNYRGMDSISISRFMMKTDVSMLLYGSGLYSLRGEGDTKEEALKELKSALQRAGIVKFVTTAV